MCITTRIDIMILDNIGWQDRTGFECYSVIMIFLLLRMQLV